MASSEEKESINCTVYVLGCSTCLLEQIQMIKITLSSSADFCLEI